MGECSQADVSRAHSRLEYEASTLFLRFHQRGIGAVYHPGLITCSREQSHVLEEALRFAKLDFLSRRTRPSYARPEPSNPSFQYARCDVVAVAMSFRLMSHFRLSVLAVDLLAGLESASFLEHYPLPLKSSL